MATNVSPEYEKADQKYREATDDDQRLLALREMLSTIPKHKGTEKMQADIKRRISQLRKAEGKKGSKRGPDPFHVPKSGAGQVVLVGPPNVGKSMLVAAATNASVKVADYPFTTAIPAPGMAMYEDAQIQLVDTPPVTAGHVPSGLMGTIRLADLLAIVVDCADEPLGQVDTVLELMADKGLELCSTPLSELDSDEPSRHSALIIANKADAVSADDLLTLRELYADRLNVWPVSAATGEGIEELLEGIWRQLAMIRVYTKQPGKSADRERPFTLPVGSTIQDLAREIHRELPEKMRFARIWGEGRFDGQQVQRTEELRDKDVVEIRE